MNTTPMMQMPPQSLPPGWQIVMDSLGRPFYYNVYTQQTSWTNPNANINQMNTSLPPGITPLNAMGSSPTPQSHIPISALANNKPQLPPGWEEAVDGQGRVYYIDHVTKKTSWVAPTTATSTMAESTLPVSSYGTPPAASNFMHNNMAYPSLTADHPPPKTTSTPYDPVFVHQEPPPPRVPMTVTVPVSAPPDPSLSALAQSKAVWDTEKVNPNCTGCNVLFTFTNRHHHCRCCQREFCNSCSSKRAPVPQFDHKTNVRVCEPCFKHLTERKDNTCLPRLVPYLTMEQSNFRLQAMCEICDLVTRDENRGIIEDLGPTNVLPPILDVLSLASKSSNTPNAKSLSTEVIGTNTQLVGIAIKFLSKATEHSVLRDNDKISSMETATALSYVLTNSHLYDEEVIVDSLRSIHNLAKRDENKTMLGSTLIPCMLPCFDAPFESIQLWAALPLLELCTDERNRTILVERNGVDLLVPLLSSKNDKLVLSVASILRLLASQERTADGIYRAGGVHFVLGLLSHREYAIQVRGLEVLTELSLLDTACQAIGNSEDGVPSIVSLLRSPHAKLQEEALTVIINLLSNRDSKDAVISAFLAKTYMSGLVSCILSESGPIVHLALTLATALVDASEAAKDSFRENEAINPLLSLAAGRKGKHLQALQVLTKLAQNNSANCNAILEIGGVSVLVDLITQAPSTDSSDVHQLDVQLYATIALGSLSSSAQVVAEFPSIEGGAGVRALVGLMQPSQDDTAREVAALALSKLTMNETCAQLVYSLGGGDHAISMLASNREPLQREALSLLAKLAAQSNNIRRSFGEATNCIGPMVSALVRDSSGIEVKRSAITCLYEVCKDMPSNRELAFASGCMAPLLSLIPMFAEEPEIQGRIVGMIASFSADNDRFRTAIRDARGIHSLVELIFTAPPASDESASLPPQVPILVSGIIALANFALARREADAAEVINSGGVLALVPLLSSPFAPLQEYAALALGNLAMVSNECRAAIVSSGAIQAAIPLFSSSTEAVVSQGLFLVGTMVNETDAESIFLTNEGMAPLVTILTAHENLMVRRGAIGLLVTMLEGSEAVWREYVKVGGVAGLIALVASEAPVAQHKGTTTLTRVAEQSSAHKRSIIDANGVPPLIGLLPSPDMASSCAAVAALAQLSVEESCSTCLVDFGALDHLVKIGSASEQGVFPAETRFQVGEIFANMAMVASCRPALCSAGAMPRLIDLLFSGAPRIAAVAAKAIGLLASDTSTAQSVFEQGGLLALLPLLTPPHDQPTRCNAALALANLCRHYPPSRQAFLTSSSSLGSDDPLGSILSIITDSTDAFRVLMLELVEALSVEPGFTRMIDKSGGLTVLVNLVDTYFDAVSDSKNAPLVVVLSILCNLCKDKDDPSMRQTLLRSTNILQLLAKVLTAPASPSLLVQLDELSLENSTAAKGGGGGELKAIEIVAALCHQEEGRTAIREASMIKPLLRVMARSFKSDSPMMMMITSKALSLLALNEANRDVIREVGGFDVLASIINGTQSNLSYVIAALDNLSFNEKNVEVMFNGGGGLMAGVVSLLSSPAMVAEEQTQCRILRLIRNLGGCESMVQLMTSSHSVVRSLVGLLYAAQTDVVRSMGTDLLLNLSRSDKVRKMLLEVVHDDRASFAKLLEHCDQRGISSAADLADATGL